MLLVDRAMANIFPTMQLEGTPWLSTWNERERQKFLTIARVVFPLIAIAFMLNYVFFDLAVDLQPRSKWLLFRVSMAALALCCFTFYVMPIADQTRFYKVPAALVCCVFCYFQGRVLVWYTPDIYVYVFAFVVLSVTILRTTLLLSLVYGISLLFVVWPSFLEAQVAAPLVVSGSILSLVTIVLLRSSYASEVAYFYAEQSNVESQKKIIELTIDFSDRLRTFLPKEITKRLDDYVRTKQMTVLQASEEVLRPRERNISCLFSDIRGFTRSTRDQDGFVVDGVLPNVKECTRVVEEEQGIPRKIGDLIFAYFDLDDPSKSLFQCVRAAARLLDQNHLSNQLADNSVISRHALVASGKAVVGNLGGFDSSIEITALGNPVNFLARMDEATKTNALSQLMKGNEILIDANSYLMLAQQEPSLQLSEVDLRALKIVIRDFEDVGAIYLLELTSGNRKLLGLPSTVFDSREAKVNWISEFEQKAG